MYKLLALFFVASCLRLLVFDYGSKYIPKRVAEGEAGEDAHFMHPNLLVVADGVGGWKKRGVNPADYSHALIELIDEHYYSDVMAVFKQPKALIIEAQKQNTFPGSSTVVVTTLHGRNLHGAYMGDSDYVIFRRNGTELGLIFHSPAQQVRLNQPYQLGVNLDSPTLAAEYTHPVEVGDLVVLGSDGLFDNLTDRELLDIAADHYGEPAAAVAEALCDEAYAASRDRTRDSPFTRAYNIAHPRRKKRRGGKRDDITVVAAYIKEYDLNDLQD